MINQNDGHHAKKDDSKSNQQPCEPAECFQNAWNNKKKYTARNEINWMKAEFTADACSYENPKRTRKKNTASVLEGCGGVRKRRTMGRTSLCQPLVQISNLNNNSISCSWQARGQTLPNKMVVSTYFAELSRHMFAQGWLRSFHRGIHSFPRCWHNERLLRTRAFYERTRLNLRQQEQEQEQER